MGEIKIKKYVVDVNVILVNPLFVKYLDNALVLLPISVLEELDKMKLHDGDSAFRVRQFFRFLREIEQHGDIVKGIELDKNVTIKTALENQVGKSTEEKLLNMMQKEFYNDYTLLTNNISVRIKAVSRGIKCEMIDSTDKHKLQELYTGVLEIQVEEERVKQFYKNGEISLENLGIEAMYPNQFIIGTTDYANLKIVGRYDIKQKKIVKLYKELSSAHGVRPKDIMQKFAFEVLLNPEIPFVSITARQGCGKTLLALATALEQVVDEPIYKKILIGKNTSPVDKWSYQGFTTGDTQEKLLSQFGNYITTFENINSIKGRRERNGLEILSALQNQNKLDILDISSILGSSFINKIVIIDEAQSFDVHAMRSIITRIGENCKLILIGDIAQQTISRLDPDKSGLYAAVEWLKDLEETAHITLKKVHRSDFVENASKAFDEKVFG